MGWCCGLVGVRFVFVIVLVVEIVFVYLVVSWLNMVLVGIIVWLLSEFMFFVGLFVMYFMICLVVL